MGHCSLDAAALRLDTARSTAVSFILRLACNAATVEPEAIAAESASVTLSTRAWALERVMKKSCMETEACANARNIFSASDKPIGLDRD